ncbi:MAG: FHA domain-containing protein [Spirochaetales bacterium]|nr:FHA domain-containing protein [Spirochaetales bacterium]
MKEYQWYLQGRLADNSPWIVPVNKATFSIGRNENQDLILPSNSVSRSHACLHMHRDELYIEDAGSKNGTFLNGSKLQLKSVLRNKDILEIGGYEFTVLQKPKGASEAEFDKTVLNSKKSHKDSFALRYGLSHRETEVLYLLLKGKKVQDIGEKLFISPGTAKLHTLNIYKKTGCHSRVELMALCQGPTKT